ncbi:GntR family transcriptional regulator [Speluncibacter jeojiensis]|uniref:GntR family transcriptional regulator n=1 Tax=Speluncibacter jeojiensis TaxID=2710754 RepID=A0A9X4LYN4_9ACTN|nr:GntR family transcriptional regulator [Corynebacteriales bacterium D3-21]
MSLDIRIDHDSSSTPPFEQLRLQILELVRRGELLAGARLPTVRALAADLGLAANTVARTYRELEESGAIETRGRQGSFIAAAGDTTRLHAQRAAMDYVRTLRDLGIDDAQALHLVEQALHATGA